MAYLVCTFVLLYNRHKLSILFLTLPVAFRYCNIKFAGA